MSGLDVTPIPASSIASWDEEADVVIAGYGVAGAAAAVEAARSGADVLVLERTGSWGGAAAMAGGFIYLGGGTALQKACGFTDSVDNMAAFLNVAMGPGADENRIADYCAASVAHFDWLVGCGVPFKAEFFSQPGWEPMGDQGLMYSGGENSHPVTTTTTRWFRSTPPGSPAGRPHRSSSTTGRRSGWRKRSARIWPIWTPPKSRSSSIRNNWCAASWSTVAGSASSPRTPIRAASANSR